MCAHYHALAQGGKIISKGIPGISGIPGIPGIPA
jgi:hypothetical protein